MRAVIIGANGQDGRYLIEDLESRGMKIFGVVRKLSSITALSRQNHLFELDMSDFAVAKNFLDSVTPDYIFHLGAVHAPSHTMKSYENDYHLAMKECHEDITENILKWQKKRITARSLIALSSQMFLNDPLVSKVITEESQPDSESPYGKSKRRAWDLLKTYRDDYGINTSGAILFNHTSSRSKNGFLFPTLAAKIEEVIKGRTSEVEVLNQLSELDMSHAQEISEALTKIVLAEKSEDFVLGSGSTITIETLLDSVSKLLGISFKISSINPPTLIHCLQSSPKKALEVLNWKVRATPIQILSEMIQRRIL